MPRKTLEERFWEKVRIAGPDECWEWQVGTNGRGYGCFYDNGKKRRATHVSMEIAGRPLQPGQKACHTCDNPPCVNEAHLIGATQGWNLSDALRKGRRKNPVIIGSDNHNTKLTEAEVHYIRLSPKSQVDLAEELGVHQTNISNIRLRKTWKHVA